MPEIFQDRFPLALLENRAADIARLVHDVLGPAYPLHDTIHFCGVVGNRDLSAVFVPRNFKGADNIAAARLTMGVLERYGRENAGRSSENPGEGESVSILPLIRDLADDFLMHGLFAERLRSPGRDSGKPDWKRTITSQTPLVTANRMPVYASIKTTHLTESIDHPLTRIQACILREISLRHGWWLGQAFISACRILSSVPEPRMARTGWNMALKSALTALYANRPMRLAGQLLAYLEEDTKSRTGSFLAGVGNFEWVWEDMLRQTLTGIETGWNEKLPKPAYRDKSGNIYPFVKGMEMDMVLRDSDGYKILDAKYYGADSLGAVPRTGDIVKQLMYENAFRTVLADQGDLSTVTNIFVFPASADGANLFEAAGLASEGVLDCRFPEIGIIYKDIAAVMRAYIERRKIPLIPSGL